MKRRTTQRSAIESCLAEAGRPLLPREVLEIAQRAVPRLSIATVYRQLKAMVDEGALRSVQIAGEPPRYEPAALGHHHHFQCTLCKRVFDVQGCPGTLADLAPAGFVVEGHEITLYGRCADCAQPPRGTAADHRRCAACDPAPERSSGRSPPSRPHTSV